MCRLIIHHFTNSSQTLQVTPPTQKTYRTQHLPNNTTRFCATLSATPATSKHISVSSNFCPYCSQMLLHHLLQHLVMQLSALRSQTCLILALIALHKRGITASSWDPKRFVLNGPCFLMEDCDFISQGHPGFLTFLLLSMTFLASRCSISHSLSLFFSFLLFFCLLFSSLCTYTDAHLKSFLSLLLQTDFTVAQ